MADHHHPPADVTSSSSLLSAIFGHPGDDDPGGDKVDGGDDKRSSKGLQKQQQSIDDKERRSDSSGSSRSTSESTEERHYGRLFDPSAAANIDRRIGTQRKNKRQLAGGAEIMLQHAKKLKPRSCGGDGDEPTSKPSVELLLERRRKQASIKFVPRNITVTAPTSTSTTTTATSQQQQHEEEDEDGTSSINCDDNVVPIEVQIREIADVVRQNGVCVVRNVADKSILDELSKAANHIHDEVSVALERQQKRLFGLFRYQEAASRCKGRVDTVHRTDAYPFNQPAVISNEYILPVIHELLNTNAVLVYAGLIFSLPGSDDQPWHQDGEPLFDEDRDVCAAMPPYAINVFIPLSDFDGRIEAGPTEFVPGSHVVDEATVMQRIDEYEKGGQQPEGCTGSNGGRDDNDETENDDDDEPPVVVAPVLHQGDALMYDYRICHRGTANVTHETAAGGRSCTGGEGDAVRDAKNIDSVGGKVRRILYLMYARPWYREHVNFGTEPLFPKNGGEH